ncbi:MAG: xylulokinase [Synergistaceae bacterium]|jgi:xylulokinase|nr:xylulokinase [Synergistaceae bacterium]
MALLLGIDIGTSSVKAVLIDREGAVLSLSRQEYSFDIPRKGWAEQDPEVWWQAVRHTVREVVRKTNPRPSRIDGIGFSGQMHGLTPLSSDGKPLRKAIIWCDQRSIAQVEKIRGVFGTEKLGTITRNPIATGFQLASLLWMKENEPHIYDKISHVLLPKDYVRYRMTGRLSTDITDASSTLALDVRHGCWAREVLDRLELNAGFYPPIFMPDEEAGVVTPEAAQATGLEAGIRVFQGGADQVMQAIGNGIIAPGQVSVTIGTGAQIFSPIASPFYDKALRSHTFNNFCRGSWYFMGATLGGGLSLKWLRDNIFPKGTSYQDMNNLAEKIPPGSEGLVFLPYLAGERTPHMDPYARGMFFGLQLNHTAGHLVRAVMEGVVFSLKDCLAVFYEMGQECQRVIASGGGAQSALWLQIQADVLQRPVYTSRMTEQASVGAAISAGVGAGVYADYVEACSAVIRWNDRPHLPIRQNADAYEEYYRLFRDLYATNKESMRRL